VDERLGKRTHYLLVRAVPVCRCLEYGLEAASVREGLFIPGKTRLKAVLSTPDSEVYGATFTVWEPPDNYFFIMPVKLPRRVSGEDGHAWPGLPPASVSRIFPVLAFSQRASSTRKRPSNTSEPALGVALR
jgi:hypothetical protein